MSDTSKTPKLSDVYDDSRNEVGQPFGFLSTDDCEAHAKDVVPRRKAARVISVQERIENVQKHGKTDQAFDDRGVAYFQSKTVSKPSTKDGYAVAPGAVRR